MEEQPRPWSKQELSLPDPTEKEEQAMPARNESDRLNGISGQELSEKAFAEKAVEDTLKQNPEIALQHAMSAAERDEAVELDHERRHEVRDQQATTPQGAVPVGQVIADAANRQPVAQSVSPPPVEPPLPTSIAQSPSEPPTMAPMRKKSLYRQAVLAGFLTALFIIFGYIVYKLVG